MQLTGNPKQDINTIKQAAAVIYPDNKIMMDLCICQAILESGVRNGGSILANKYNNLFGIKGKGIKTGHSVMLPTKEDIKGKIVSVKDAFAWNGSVEESFMQHRKILSLPRYKLVWQAKTLPEAAEAVKNGGYATDRAYPQKLIAIASTYLVT